MSSGVSSCVQVNARDGCDCGGAFPVPQHEPRTRFTFRPYTIEQLLKSIASRVRLSIVDGILLRMVCQQGKHVIAPFCGLHSSTVNTT